MRVRLGEVCEINMGQSPASSTYNEEEKGLPFFQGNADFGEIYPTARIWCDEPTKVAHIGDILISVRAPIGALNLSNCKCCIGRGLAALTVNKNICLQKYLWYVLAGKNGELNSKGTGSTFKAINKNILAETEIPLPSLDEQHKIVMLLDKVSGVIAERRKQVERLDDLVKSRFIEMFGDPVSNSCRLPEATLPELGEFGRGVSKHRPRNAPELLGGSYPLIQTGEVASANLYVTSYSNTYSEMGFRQSKMWNKGTLCITIAANIAKTAILGFDACFPDSVVGFNANERANNIYIHYWFSFFQTILEAQAPESAQKNINLKILSELKVIVPSVDKQNEFAAFVQQTDKLELVAQKSLEKLEILKKSLMQQYFG